MNKRNLYSLLFPYFFFCGDLFALEPAGSATITIDAELTYQTIQGFGGFGAEKVWWDEQPFYSDEFVDLLINDLGITILRENIPITFEPENDNGDPNSLDLSQFNLSKDYPGADSHLGQHLPYLKAMHEAGLEKLIVSIWSPPIWMKHNDHRGNGSDPFEGRTSAPPHTTTPDDLTNQLRVDLHEEFAEYCVAYIRILKRETGIDLYAISLQNEPRFSQFYASAVYSPESLRDLIKVVGSRFESEGISTKIFAPEDVQSLYHVLQYLGAIFDDQEASRYTDIVAIHNYHGDGVQPSDSSPQNWAKTASIGLEHNKEIWMTETSGFSTTDMAGGIALAKSIYNAMKYGQISAWVYWQMSGNLIDKNGNKTFLYDVSRHYYRHARPGALRVSAESNNEDVLPLAFLEPKTGKLSIILINDSDQPYHVDLRENRLGEFSEIYFTSEDLRYESRPDLISGDSDSVTLPRKSIATLVTMGI